MSDSEEDAALEGQVKISLVGESATGKSMLCARYLGLQWAGARTQGAEVLLGECRVLPARPPRALKLCDVGGGGGARDTSMLDNYLYASQIIILVYDITNLPSFDLLGTWLERVRSAFPADSRPVVAIFGNKCDLEHQRAVRLACVQAFSQEHGVASFTGSARTGENVNSTIITLVSQALGIPVNKSLFASTIVKAELAPRVRKKSEDKKSTNNNNITGNFNAGNKKNKKKGSLEQGLKNENEIIKKNKKSIKELTRQASSAVCNLQ